MKIEKLNTLPKSYAFAVEEMVCDSCGKSIQPSEPYLQTSRTVLVKGELALKQTFECLKACSDFKLATTDQDEFGIKPRPGNWATVPEVAGADEKSYRIETNRGTWVATGYVRILTMGHSEFIEVADDQIQKRAFARDHQNSSETYNAWVTPCGFKARSYLSEDRWCHKGFWYLTIGWITINKTPRLPLMKKVTR